MVHKCVERCDMTMISAFVSFLDQKHIVCHRGREVVTWKERGEASMPYLITHAPDSTRIMQ